MTQNITKLKHMVQQVKTSFMQLVIDDDAVSLSQFRARFITITTRPFKDKRSRIQKLTDVTHMSQTLLKSKRMSKRYRIMSY